MQFSIGMYTTRSGQVAQISEILDNDTMPYKGTVFARTAPEGRPQRGPVVTSWSNEGRAVLGVESARDIMRPL